MIWLKSIIKETFDITTSQTVPLKSPFLMGRNAWFATTQLLSSTFWPDNVQLVPLIKNQIPAWDNAHGVRITLTFHRYRTGHNKEHPCPPLRDNCFHVHLKDLTITVKSVKLVWCQNIGVSKRMPVWNVPLKRYSISTTKGAKSLKHTI